MRASGTSRGKYAPVWDGIQEIAIRSDTDNHSPSFVAGDRTSGLGFAATKTHPFAQYYEQKRGDRPDMKRFAFFAACFLPLVIFGCTNYGTKLEYGNGELFYAAAVSETEAKNLGEFLNKTGYFKGDQGKSVQLDKQGRSFAVKFVVSKGADKDQEALDALQVMARLISKNVFNQSLVRVHMCDDQFKTLKVVSSDQ